MVHRRGEQLHRHGDVAAGGGLGLDDAHAELVVGVLEHRQGVAVLADRGDRARQVVRPFDLVLDEAVQDHQLGRGGAEVGAEPRVVALVLLQVLDEAAPLRLGQLQRVAVA